WPHWGKCIQTAVPVAVKLDLLRPAWDLYEDEVAAVIAVRFITGYPGRAVKRLVYVADEMNNQAQRLCPLFIASAVLQNVHIRFEGIHNIVGRHIRQRRSIVRERRVDEV